VLRAGYEQVGPVVDALAAHVQQLGDLSDGLPAVEFQEGQEASVVAGVPGAAELPPEVAPLR